MNPLQAFYLDEGTREAVKAFLISELEKQTIKKVFNGESVVGILEARQLVDASFSEMEYLFKPKKDKEQETAE